VSCPVPHSASQIPSTSACVIPTSSQQSIFESLGKTEARNIFGSDMVQPGRARGLLGALLLCSSRLAQCLRYDPSEADWNLNTNQAATSPLDYSGTWQDHTFFPSPENWRFPFYTLFLDRFVNGDPSNDDINGTLFEQDIMGTTMRHGGDLAGLVDTLDYIQGMGIKVS
jgi:alpha-1,3-glucan synthase